MMWSLVISALPIATLMAGYVWVIVSDDDPGKHRAGKQPWGRAFSKWNFVQYLPALAPKVRNTL